ncbi:DUF3306 domain-containing protein [Bradyrhizobium sp.]|jgi:hypothetical protein|uniref:DUF3306 domain-containing protein n=1 Tax=Bradyrhizobium sp. TaxID=376 RepID=UPI002C97CC1B|nr:DUF3306 domain-containing protein [Bradyrhizobium sp.]HWX58944.1 DUF3306 domain-containing protein [Bradyrhizobium sp.]
MSEQENLLLRWARLKQAVKAAEEIDGASAGSEAMAAPETPFDPASLPSIVSIAADTDIIAFLRAGVPAELTRAALRRAWTSDPAIRDFIGIAENQWDFNDPNAIPGFGPLVPTESGVDILAQVSSRLERQPRTLEALAAAEPTIASSANAHASDRQLVINDPPLVNPGAAPNEMLAPAEGENTPTVSESRKARRHGSALPH